MIFRNIIIWFLVSTVSIAHAQNIRLGPYKATTSFSVYNCDQLPKEVIILKNSVFEILSNSGDVWTIGIYDKERKKLIQICKADKGILQENSVSDERYSYAMTAGLITNPLKYRPPASPSEFSTSTNLGLSLGLKLPYRSWRKTQYSVVTAYSLGNIVLDSSNTSGNQNLLVSVNNFTAISLSIGLVVQYNNLQIGAFLGVDKINAATSQRFGWTHQGKPWIGLGVGYEIFSTEKKKNLNCNCR